MVAYSLPAALTAGSGCDKHDNIGLASTVWRSLISTADILAHRALRVDHRSVGLRTSSFGVIDIDRSRLMNLGSDKKP